MVCWFLTFGICARTEMLAPKAYYILEELLWVKAGKEKTSSDLKQASALQTALMTSRIKTTSIRRDAKQARNVPSTWWREVLSWRTWWLASPQQCREMSTATVSESVYVVIQSKSHSHVLLSSYLLHRWLSDHVWPKLSLRSQTPQWSYKYSADFSNK